MSASGRLRWGVLGVSEQVGRLAVCPALAGSPTAEFLAIASRDLARAKAEADRFGVPRAYGDYGALLADPDVQAVYIPLPNHLHRPWTLQAAAAGKHVLCEKPLALNAAEAREMAEACERARAVLMEAYMPPFHPRSRRVLALASSGALGQLRFARAVFTFPLRDPGNYRWRPEMGGGSLLDVGIYCLAPVLAAAGGSEPAWMAGRAVRSPSGVDASFHGWLDFGTGFSGTFETSFEVPERQRLEFVGTDAALVVERPFTPSVDDTTIHLIPRDGEAKVVTSDGNDPYLAMVEHFAAVVRGEAAPSRPPEDSVTLLGLMDRLRAAAGM